MDQEEHSVFMESDIAQFIQTAGPESKYDDAARELVSEKAILAYILKSAMDEFADYPVERIAAEFIEGKPEVSKIAVFQDHPDKNESEDTGSSTGKMSGSDRIVGEPTEDVSFKEGPIRYDIRFNVIIPESGQMIEVIINIEIQNNDTPGYPIPKRGIYYGARMISAQRGTVFKKQDYGKIKKVVSIWLCQGTANERSDSINEYHITEKVKRGEFQEETKNYDLMTIVVLRLGKDGEKSEDNAIRLLSKVFSTDLSESEKKRALSDEFNIEITEQISEEVLKVCNLSTGVLNKGREQGRVEGREQGRVEGREQGRVEGTLKTLLDLVRDGLLKLEEAAPRANMSESAFMEQLEKYVAQ